MITTCSTSPPTSLAGAPSYTQICFLSSSPHTCVSILSYFVHYHIFTSESYTLFSKDPQTSSSELQDPGLPALKETQVEPNKQTDPQAKLEIPTSDVPVSVLLSASPVVCSSSPSPHLTDCSSQGKKKKNLFSKGKKLLRKLGSSKKD